MHETRPDIVGRQNNVNDSSCTRPWSSSWVPHDIISIFAPPRNKSWRCHWSGRHYVYGWLLQSYHNVAGLSDPEFSGQRFCACGAEKWKRPVSDHFALCTIKVAVADDRGDGWKGTSGRRRQQVRRVAYLGCVHLHQQAQLLLDLVRSRNYMRITWSRSLMSKTVGTFAMALVSSNQQE